VLLFRRKKKFFFFSALSSSEFHFFWRRKKVLGFFGGNEKKSGNDFAIHTLHVWGKAEKIEYLSANKFFIKSISISNADVIAPSK
jgi:hypothetical protein